MPSLPTARVSKGRARYAGGDAGEARLHTASTLDADVSGSSTFSLTLVTTRVKRSWPGQMGHVLPGSGGEVVETDDGVAPLDQVVAQVRAQEAGAAGHHDSAHWRPIPV